MLLKSLLPGLLAAVTVKAFPAPDLEDGHGEIEVFKRDAELDARDLELADMHNVNLTEMYKHSQIKRADGDHISIWVHRSLVETNEEGEQAISRRQNEEPDEDEQPDDEDEQPDEDGPGVAKRQQQHVRLGHGADYSPNWSSDRCHTHSRDKRTNSGSPFKGGVDAMFNWANSRGGAFWVNNGGAWQPLVVAGSNSGANAVHRVQAVGSGSYYFGVQDVRNDADWTRNHAETFDGRVRCSSTGRETCSGARVRYQVVQTDERSN